MSSRLSTIFRSLYLLIKPVPVFEHTRLVNGISKITHVLIVDVNETRHQTIFRIVNQSSNMVPFSVSSIHEALKKTEECDILIYVWSDEDKWVDANHIVHFWLQMHKGPICVVAENIDTLTKRALHFAGVMNVIEGHPTDSEVTRSILRNYAGSVRVSRLLDRNLRSEYYLLEYIEMLTQEITTLKKYIPILVLIIIILLISQLMNQEVPWDLILKILG